MPEGDPEIILEDMDFDGVDVQVMHPNLSLFGLYSDDHEAVDGARARLQRLRHRAVLAATSRIAPTAPVPLTDIDDAVAEIERRRRRIPRDSAVDPAPAVLLARVRPGVGRGLG